MSRTIARGQPAASPPELGVNLEEVTDWGRSFMFADAMKHARPWGSYDKPYDERAPLDADGWPTGDAGVQIIVDVPGQMIAGTYRLSFRGDAEVSGTAPVRNKVHHRETGITTAEVVVPPTIDQVTLRFAGQRGGVKDVKLIRPGHTEADLFYKPFLQRLAPFTVLRAMDYLATNGNPQVNWNDRTLPAYATQQRREPQGKTRGGAWEYLIELANQTGKSLWINVPDQATDDYVRHLAGLLRATLRPELKIYVEWSNEVWNDAGPFEQTQRNYAATRAEVRAGHSNLPYDREKDNYVLAWRRIARRGKEISDIFRSVFGDDAMMTRIRPVLASQVARPEVLAEGLRFIEAVYGPPGRYFFGCAAGVYLGVDERTSHRPDLTLEQIFAAMAVDAAQEARFLSTFSGWCRAFGLEMLAYEGGQSLDGETSLEVKLRAQNDPRMTELLGLGFRNWFEAGGGLFNYYDLCSVWGKWGSWGLSDDIHAENTAKWGAIRKALSAPKPSANIGERLPATLEPRHAFSARDYYDAGAQRIIRGPDGFSMYLVRAPAAARYQVSTYLFGSLGATARLFVDSQLAATWGPPSLGPTAQSASIWLDAGLHVLRVQPGKGAVSYGPLVIHP